ncbi:hypothetical protein H0H81_006299 [Sphagnurus paluster]|uniref:Uncharacterized protein n=1 Tax=Sphagnurus paluster TaxID=117069 RepID=A0A9P7FTT9_9AGAR|nr:hypothetical protein H0H81_006299 [Sphagnurus paluster]
MASTLKRQLRESLLPLLEMNARRRPDWNDEESSNLNDRLRETLTDEFCDSLAEKVRSIQLQMQAIRSEDTSRCDNHSSVITPTCSAGIPDMASIHNPSASTSIWTLPPASAVAGRDLNMTSPSNDLVSSTPPEPPKAPRAMRILLQQRHGQPTIDSTSRDQAFLEHPKSRSGSRDNVPGHHFRIKRELSQEQRVIDTVPPIPNMSMPVERDLNVTTRGIPIPIDPSFFPALAASPVVVHKRESPSPSRPRQSISRPSRSPIRGRSFSQPPAPGTDRRRSSRSPLYRRHSPPPQTWSPRRQRSRSRPLDRYTPPAKRRRRSLSRPHSPPPYPYRSGSPSRYSSARRPRSPIRRTSTPPTRKTPVHLRTISRTFGSPSPTRRHSAVSKPRSPVPPLSPLRDANMTRRSPSLQARRQSTFTKGNRSPPYRDRGSFSMHHAPPPRRSHRSPSPATPVLPRRRPHSISSTSTSPPPRPNYRHRLSRPPDENHPQLQSFKTNQAKIITSSRPLRYPSPSTHRRPAEPSIRYRTSSDKGQLKSAETVKIKPEPDVEDYTAALRPLTLPGQSLATVPPAPHVSSPSPVSSHSAAPSTFPAPSTTAPAPSPSVLSPAHSPAPAPSPTPAPVFLSTLTRSPVTIPSQALSHSPTPSPPAPKSELGPGPEPHPLPAATSEPVLMSSTPSLVQMASRAPVSEPSATAAPTLAASTSVTPTPDVLPCHSVPGLWMVRVGQDGAQVLDYEFEVDAETIRKWDLASLDMFVFPSYLIYSVGLMLRPSRLSKLSLRFLCLRKDFLQANQEDAMAALTMTTPEWPSQGSLIVQMNPGETRGHSWLPNQMVNGSNSVYFSPR